MPTELRDSLAATAQSERRSVSNLVRLLVEDGLLTRRLEQFAFQEFRLSGRTEEHE